MMTDPDAPSTGHPRVDAALTELGRIGALAPADQVAGFTAVQRELQETLADIDGNPGRPVPGPGGAA
jgi:hypothetical protein